MQGSSVLFSCISSSFVKGCHYCQVDWFAVVCLFAIAIGGSYSHLLICIVSVCFVHVFSFLKVPCLHYSHEFHKACIDPWLLDKRTCPMCKLDILKSLAVPDPQPPETSSISSEAHLSSPRHTLCSDDIAQDTDVVELRSIRSGSELRDPADGSSGLSEDVSSQRTSQIVTIVQVTSLSDHRVENVSDDEVAHYTVCNIEGEPNRLPEIVSSECANPSAGNKLTHCSSNTLTCQTSDQQYDSRDCLI